MNDLSISLMIGTLFLASLSMMALVILGSAYRIYILARSPKDEVEE